MATYPSEWNDALVTGHPEMDDQHHDLLVAHAAALELARSGDEPAMRASLLELLELTRKHFAFEERLMVESAYSGRTQHAKAHVAFVRDLLALLEVAARDASAAAVRLWLGSRYDSWWKHHLRSNDVLLASHLAGAPLLEAAGGE